MARSGGVLDAPGQKPRCTGSRIRGQAAGGAAFRSWSFPARLGTTGKRGERGWKPANAQALRTADYTTCGTRSGCTLPGRGLPLPRLQRLMGHASPTMTMRYMRHAPSGDFPADAARIAESMSFRGSTEAETQLPLAPRLVSAS
jgi:integrase